MLIDDPDIITIDVEVHTPKRCAPAITDRLEHMRGLLAKYRSEAIALHARLVALELAGNDNIAPLRRALIESSVQIESISQFIEGRCPKTEARLARGSEAVEPIDEWVEQPTLKRQR